MSNETCDCENKDCEDSELPFCPTWSDIFKEPTVCLREKCAKYFPLTMTIGEEEKIINFCLDVANTIFLQEVSDTLFELLLAVQGGSEILEEAKNLGEFVNNLEAATDPEPDGYM